MRGACTLGMPGFTLMTSSDAFLNTETDVSGKCCPHVNLPFTRRAVLPKMKWSRAKTGWKGQTSRPAPALTCAGLTNASWRHTAGTRPLHPEGSGGAVHPDNGQTHDDNSPTVAYHCGSSQFKGGANTPNDGTICSWLAREIFGVNSENSNTELYKNEFLAYSVVQWWSLTLIP